jgi:hypothetical protein
MEVLADGLPWRGEVSAGETPGYNAETTDTAWHVISDFIAPFLVVKSMAAASELPGRITQIRGHEMAPKRGGCKKRAASVVSRSGAEECWSPASAAGTTLRCLRESLLRSALVEGCLQLHGAYGSSGFKQHKKLFRNERSASASKVI